MSSRPSVHSLVPCRCWRTTVLISIYSPTVSVKTETCFYFYKVLLIMTAQRRNKKLTQHVSTSCSLLDTCLCLCSSSFREHRTSSAADREEETLGGTELHTVTTWTAETQQEVRNTESEVWGSGNTSQRSNPAVLPAGSCTKVLFYGSYSNCSHTQ